MSKSEFTLSDAVLLTFATMLTISLIFGTNISPWFVDENWLFLAVFVLVMLIQSLFTRFCFVAKMLQFLFPKFK